MTGAWLYFAIFSSPPAFCICFGVKKDEQIKEKQERTRRERHDK
jgi:hypothetical protein